MTIDVVICTYNRPQQCAFLISQLLSLDTKPNCIWVIDASESVEDSFKNRAGITWVPSNHKNQPYQRFVGWSLSMADILLYLDDDMEVADAGCIETIRQHFETQPQVLALALHFKNKQEGGSLSDIPQSQFNQQSKIKKLWNWVSGYPSLPPGAFGYCGHRGKQPVEGGVTQWISGGAFAVKRNSMYQNFNFQLFDLFEEKLGMGEDGSLGYSLSKQGDVYYEPKQLFWHHEQHESHYATNQQAYAKRVLFSRLFLSLEKARLDGSSIQFATWHYYWYAFCRILGYYVNYYKSPTEKRKQILKGSKEGFRLARSFQFINNDRRRAYWQQELEKQKSVLK